MGTPNLLYGSPQFQYFISSHTNLWLECLVLAERYHPDEDRWAFVAPMSVCRSGHGLGVINGCLYALGGHDGVSYRNTVECFDPKFGEWDVIGPVGMCKAVAGVSVLKDY